MLAINWVALLAVAVDVVVALVVAVFVSANRKPSSAIAWVLAVIFIPVIGILFFLLVGAGRLPKHRRDKQHLVTSAIQEKTQGGLAKLSSRDQWPEWLPSIAQLNWNLGALPMVGGNTAELCDDYIGSIKIMIEDIDQARDYVHVEFFIFVYDDTTAPFFDALARACRRGVTVRVLSDHIAQYSYPNRKKTLEVLREMGAHYQPMLPLQPFKGHWRRPDLRNHRKLVVIDGRIGHTGSLNMIMDHYHGKANIAKGLHWHELMARFQGPVVRALDAVFVTDWFSETKDLLPLDYSPVVLSEEP